MTGGTINGSGPYQGGHTTITINGASTTATISANSTSSSANSTYSVASGGATIALSETGVLSGGYAAGTVTKSGTGVMQLTGNNTETEGTFAVAAGTLLIDNTSGSGTGTSAVSVSGGATLGGTGTIGGTAGVTLAGTSGNLATLSPGDIGSIGTLNVGTGAQNNVTIGNYSQLNIGLSGSSASELNVNGAISLSSSNDCLALSGTPTGASYTIVYASGGITGYFDSVTGMPSGYSLVYSTNSIQLVSGTVIDAWTGRFNTSWNDYRNWDHWVVPRSTDTASFTGSAPPARSLSTPLRRLTNWISARPTASPSAAARRTRCRWPRYTRCPGQAAKQLPRRWR